jgi:hypothetical protein
VQGHANAPPRGHLTRDATVVSKEVLSQRTTDYQAMG